MIRYTKTVAPFIEQGKTLRVGFQNVNLTASLLWDFFFICLDVGTGVYACTHLCGGKYTQVWQMCVKSQELTNF